MQISIAIRMVVGIAFVLSGIILFILYIFKPKCQKNITNVAAIISVIIGAIALLPLPSINTTDNSESINGSLDEEAKSFVWLSELTPEDNGDSSGFTLYDTVTDNLSNIYKNGFGGSDSHTENVEIYSINQKYQSFRGTVVLNYDYRASNTENAYVKIYGDDVVLWISPLITAGQAPVSFELNEEIISVETLKITIYGSDEIRLVDCALYVDAADPTETTCTPYAPKWGDTVSLAELNTYNASNSSGNSFEYTEVFTDNLGIQYSSAFKGIHSYEENWETYYVNQSFAEFKGYVALDYNDRSTTKEYIVKIYGDDTLLFTSNVFTAGTEPQLFSIPVLNYKKITVVLPGSSVALVDARLHLHASDTIISTGVSQDPSQGKDKIPLIMLDYVASSSSSGGFKTYGIVKDNLGTVYADGIGGRRSYEENWESYKLSKQYKKIEGKIVVNYDSRSKQSDDVYVKFYNGDTVFYTSPLITAGVEPIEFSIDISDVDTLKISFMGTNDIVRLVDIYLYK